MKHWVLGWVAAAALLSVNSAMAGGRVGFYAGFGPGPYYAPYPYAYPYPVYRPYYYGPAYYPPPPPYYRAYPPYPVYPGFGVGYFSPGLSIRVGR